MFINPSVCETLDKLFNRCFNERHFPRTLKNANVIPMYITGNENDFGNCRLTSLLPVISKDGDKGLQKLTVWSKYSVINKAQFVYQARINKIDALSEVNETIRVLCSRKKMAIGFLLVYRMPVIL